ncbi:PAAR domain-containing protein [Pseudomonas wadenswilerensis]
MNPVALPGHRHRCPIHGIGHVTTGATDATVNGRPIARVGDSISCGASVSAWVSDPGMSMSKLIPTRGPAPWESLPRAVRFPAAHP